MYIENAYSAERLSIYQNWVRGDKNKAIALCNLNMVIAESFYPVLHIFEDTLKDKINRSLIKHIGKNWCFHNRVKFASKFDLENVNSKLANPRNKNNSENSANNLFITNANFFYWTNILNPINQPLWEKGLKQIFKSENTTSQIDIFDKINLLRKLRNQISHHRPIIQYDLATRYKNSRKILGMLSRDALECCDLNSRFWDVHPRIQIIQRNFVT